MNANSQKIEGLAAPTSGTDAINRETADGRYYQSSVVLQSIAAAVTSLDLNSQKITGLAVATAAADALSREAGDVRYYQ